MYTSEEKALVAFLIAIAINSIVVDIIRCVFPDIIICPLWWAITAVTTTIVIFVIGTILYWFLIDLWKSKYK